MSKRKKVFEMACKPPYPETAAIVHVDFTFTLLHLMNFLTSRPSHSLLRCFRCVSGGLKMAFAAVSNGASASQQTPPVLSPTCVLNSWTHSCREVHLLLALILQGLNHRPAIRFCGPGLEVHPGGHTSSESVSHYCGPIASSYQRTKRRNPSFI